MCASILSALFCGMKPREFGKVLVSIGYKLIAPTVTVAAMLAMAYMMNYSGATGTLGLAFATTGRVFPFFSPMLGWLGVFLTGSDTSSNALFGPLQVVSAEPAGFRSGADGGGELGGRRDGQDDQPAVDCGGCGCDGADGRGPGEAVPLHAEAQHLSGERGGRGGNAVGVSGARALKPQRLSSLLC